jgi:nucleotide-binding universal stress UspA family protein
MSADLNNVLLAVDFAAAEPVSHVSAVVDVVCQLVRDGADHVTVLHVREFSIGRLAAMMREHGGADGRRAVDQVVSALRAAGVTANGQIREADGGHVAQAILDAAREAGARFIVVSSVRRPVPIGSVAQQLLHRAQVPVVVVPAPSRVPRTVAALVS